MPDGTRTSDFHFVLPPELIAQSPAAVRDDSRLMIVERESGRISHARFRDLAGLMASGDVLVVNTSRVLRARLLGTRSSGAAAEILLLKPLGDNQFEAMVHPGGKLRPGRRVRIAADLEVEILSVTERRTRVVRLITSAPVDQAIERHGHVPLPPYIERPDVDADAERYQTVYSDVVGSVAAPTAGLHFTPSLLDAIQARAIRRAELVLHVGAGTFRPVESDDPAEHVMHEEVFTISQGAAHTINAARDAGGRTWAVGTTSVRALESAASAEGRIQPATGETRIFIRPPYRFRAVDKLVTNFHLPRSTLIMLVAAFAGYELTMHAYREAVNAGYRFYSYGDAMVVL